MAHYVEKFDEGDLQSAHQARNEGYSQTALVDHTIDSVHTGGNLHHFDVGQIPPSGDPARETSGARPVGFS